MPREMRRGLDAQLKRQPLEALAPLTLSLFDRPPAILVVHQLAEPDAIAGRTRGRRAGPQGQLLEIHRLAGDRRLTGDPVEMALEAQVVPGAVFTGQAHPRGIGREFPHRGVGPRLRHELLHGSACLAGEKVARHAGGPSPFFHVFPFRLEGGLVPAGLTRGYSARRVCTFATPGDKSPPRVAPSSRRR